MLSSTFQKGLSERMGFKERAEGRKPCQVECTARTKALR
jgi:hypothetical protein